jgi:hypothetical protein
LLLSNPKTFGTECRSGWKEEQCRPVRGWIRLG